MFNVADYFKKFKRLEGDSLVQKEAIEKALREICNIQHARYSLEKGILTIKGSPVLRSVVFTKKAPLLHALQGALPQAHITEIR